MKEHDCRSLQNRDEGPPDWPDAALIDPPTIEEIQEAAGQVLHAPAVQQLAGQLRLSAADLEDVEQEVLFKAWRARERYSRVFHLRTWIGSITRNAMLDLYRKQRRRRTRPLMDREGRQCIEPAAPTREPAVELIHRDLATRLEEVLAQGSPVVRQIAALRGGGKTFAETAAQMGRTPAAVVSIWHRFKVRTLESLAGM